MASILRFVDSDLATIRLTLNWIEDQTDLNLPAHEKQWNDSPRADGRKYIGGHWTGRTLKLALAVKGISKPDMDADLRALIAELTRENILEFYPDGGSPVFIKTHIMDDMAINGLTKEYYRNAFTLHPVMVSLPTDPFWFAAKQTLTPVLNIIPGGNFEVYAGSGNTTDWTEWVETRTNGAGTATVEALAAAAVFGLVGCHLKITSDDGVASITSAAFTASVDPTKHAHLGFHGYRVSGADSLKCKIKQYNAAGADLGDDITITPAGAASWRFYPTIIHQAGAGGNDFHASCAKIKLVFTVDTATADWYIDCIAMTQSEYLSGNELTNALGIVIPPADILGDVPSPVDIYIDKWDSTVAATSKIYIGGRDTYDAGFVARLENSQGTAALSNLVSGGAYRTQVVPGELMVNSDLENITGTPGSNTETFDNWTITRPGTSYLTAAPYPYSGTYCAVAFPVAQGLFSPSMISDFTAVNIAFDHVISVWHRLYQETGSAVFKVEVLCYNAADALQGTLVPITSASHQEPYKKLSYTIAAATWPATTTKVKVRITATVAYQSALSDSMLWDLVSLQMTSSAPAAVFEDYSDHFKGNANLFLHYKISAAQTAKALALQGKLKDDALGDITSLDELETLTVSMPDDWIYQQFSRLALPTARIPDTADTSGIEQYLEVGFDSSIAGGPTLSLDDLALIPTDNGYTEIPAESNQHLIIDSNSDAPAVLTSIDGTLDTAVIYSMAAHRMVFRIDPQKGLNLGALMDFRDSSGNAVGQWLADVKLTYYPRYLVVK